MHLRNSQLSSLLIATALFLGLSTGVALAEAGKPAPVAAPAPAAAPATPAATPAAEPAAATPAAAPSAAAPAPAAAPAAVAAPAPTAAPAIASSAPTPGQNPPPAPYPMLGGQSEAPIEKGEWNPWDHPAPGRYGHEGFFMRLTLGFGGGNVSSHYTRFSGAGLGMGLALGGSIVENLALHVDFQRTMLLGPSQKPAQPAEHVDSISLSSMGLGLTYYIMPVNIYLSGSAGLGTTTFEDNSGQQYGDSYAGFVMNLMAGKEWWVGYDWGVGVAAQFLLMTLKNDYDGRLVSSAVNLLFTATYN